MACHITCYCFALPKSSSRFHNDHDAVTRTCQYRHLHFEAHERTCSVRNGGEGGAMGGGKQEICVMESA